MAIHADYDDGELSKGGAHWGDSGECWGERVTTHGLTLRETNLEAIKYPF